jgi:hypothetical protein
MLDQEEFLARVDLCDSSIDRIYRENRRRR